MHVLAAQTRAFSQTLSSCPGYALFRNRRTAPSMQARWFGTITNSRVARTSLGSPGLARPQDRQSECVRRTHSQVSDVLPPFDHTKRFRFTQPPCPEWTYGDGMKLFKEEDQNIWGATEAACKRKVWDLEGTSSKETYQLLTSAIVPRPIAFVSTLSDDGTPNLAPFSYFSMISHNPPLLSVSFALSQRRPKDSRENILQTKEFTVNIISEPFIEAANSTSVESPAGMNEWLLSGLTPAKSVLVKPPIVEESAPATCDLSTEDQRSIAVLIPKYTEFAFCAPYDDTGLGANQESPRS
ncbi:hypothetical protein D9756_005362 [Leucocoprinus leucothites]|uniref:Flavin reductase like domain-containing protein n=1 Tax=Leucocoprinus leucothites TaxID=201217 RepID=A0A8H5D7Z2_9AGAR|nr:hypothetical protein D9756_005362 [Leucoagaricus leucothites]